MEFSRRATTWRALGAVLLCTVLGACGANPQDEETLEGESETPLEDAQSEESAELAVVDPYADAATPSGLNVVLNPNNAVGAPDGQRATVLSILGGSLLLDMGQGEEGRGPLRIHYGGLTLTVLFTVDFLSADRTVIATGQANLIQLGVGRFSVDVPYSNATPYRYVRLNRALAGLYLIDAVETTGPLCGDGRVGTGESCDDGNRTANDGCSTICQVEPGYTCQGSPSVCTDVNECTNGTSQCSVNATCTNTPGSYTCTCKAGYSGNGRTCNDINECTNGTSQCSVNATCSNTQGSYNCTCKAGYSGNGRTCNDINECTNGTSQCSVNATCSNTQGSYNCTCKAGYTGNGRTCTDINECTNGTHTCTPGQRCVNQPGGFDCIPGSCPPPQVKCGSSCVNANTDPANCGCCGNTCGAGKTCTNGVCGARAPLGTPLGVTASWERAQDQDLIVRTPNGELLAYGPAKAGALAPSGPEGTPPSGTYFICLKSTSFEASPTDDTPVPYSLTVKRQGQADHVLRGVFLGADADSLCGADHPSLIEAITYP
ncbi:EGF domain-containing protein [Myxococcus sp. AS-1-15]|uniref:EGF domain-containing protein n=2 Tax=unclassified Myxococcus TaxID=2648731 RepID=UPI001CBE19AF|nr:EGF domain-containing protein [Myxococcus sp. AS-1-15]MBZ4400690.1 EGF domain-containing protein [Myxococcus sp. AS-1-15]